MCHKLVTSPFKTFVSGERSIYWEHTRAIESAHAVAYVKKAAESGELGDVVVINLSGRGGQGCVLCCEAGGILSECQLISNYSGMLIGLPIAIL